MMSKTWLTLGSVFAFVGVALGAFGAHGLREKLTPRAMEIFNTAVQYQFIHALALLALGLWAAQNTSVSTALPGWAFTAGIAVFSGSLYVLAVTDIKILGAITPLGGLAFLLGWAAFTWTVRRS
jgi:uncharacterized membrane protein YgdD (TMEM256/DUF423 family)